EGVRVGRSKTGPFEPLRKVAQFRDVAAKLDPVGNRLGVATPLPGALRSRPRLRRSSKQALPAALRRPPDPASGPVPLIDLGQPRSTDGSSTLVILFLLTVIAGAGAFVAWHVLQALRLV